MKKLQSNPHQLTLCIDKPISALLREMKTTRHPLAIEAINKIEEAQRLLEYIQQTGVVKSTTAKTAIYELLTKF